MCWANVVSRSSGQSCHYISPEIEETAVVALHPQDVALPRAPARRDRPDGVGAVGGMGERPLAPGRAPVARAPALDAEPLARLAREQDHPRVLVVERDPGRV